MGVQVTGDGVSLSVGAVWQLAITVTNGYDVPVSVTPTVTLMPPSGPDVDVPVTNDVVSGYWVASYLTAAAGVHLAIVDAGVYGAVAVSANVLAVVGAAARPDRAALDAYLGEHSATDEQLDDALAAETQAQWDVCRVPAAYPVSLRQALLRRCARNLALRGLPLAVLRGDGEAGDTILPGRDPEVRRLEGPWRKLVVG